MKVFPYEMGVGGTQKVLDPRFSHFVAPPLHPITNDQSLIPINFEDLVLFSPSEIKRELCGLMILISQGIVWYKVPVVGKDGKLNETIERSAFWSIQSIEIG